MIAQLALKLSCSNLIALLLPRRVVLVSAADDLLSIDEETEGVTETGDGMAHEQDDVRIGLILDLSLGPHHDHHSVDRND